MHRPLCFTLLFMACIPLADAASCRAATAAQAGSEAGYNRAKSAAEAWSQRENTISASMGDCLGDISTTITSPVFPSLSDLLNQTGQKICKAARDQISDYVPSTIDPWGDLPTSVNLPSINAVAPVWQAPPSPQPQAPVSDATGTESGKSFISLN